MRRHRCRSVASLGVVLLAVAVTGCNESPRPGTYDQVVREGGAMARSGYRGTLVIEPENRYRIQLPVLSISGAYRREGDSLYFESGSGDVRVTTLRGRASGDTLILEQPPMGGALRGVLGDDVAVLRFVRRR